MLYQASQHTALDILILRQRTLSRLLVFRQMNHLREHSCLMVVLRWLRKLLRCMVTSQTRTSIRSLQSITRHITRQYLMPIHQR